MKKRSRSLFNLISFRVNQRGSIAVPHIPTINFHPGHETHAVTGSLRFPLLLTLAATLGSFQIVALGFAASTTFDSSTMFTYSNQSVCTARYVLLPSFSEASISQSYNLEYGGGISLGDTPLLTSKICAVSHSAPQENTAETLRFSAASLPFLNTNFIINSSQLPGLTSTPDPSGPIATTSNLLFELAAPDEYFAYSIIGNEKQVDCKSEKTILNCPISNLNLQQSETYNLALTRSYNGVALDPAPFSAEFKTVSAIKATKTSIKNKQTVYDKPQSIVITFDKTLSAADSVNLTNSTSEDNKSSITTESTVNGSTLTITWEQQLARSSNFEVSVTGVSATDEAVLEKPIKLSFSTSGGPRIIATSLASYGERLSPDFNVTFDYPVNEQSLKSLITFTADNQPVAFNYSLSGKTLRIYSTEALSRCQTFVVSVAAGAANIHGVGGGIAWTQQSRTLCQSISNIGTSVQGRAISSYRFGSGGQTVLFVGGTHGSEPSSVSTLQSWINSLEAEYTRIPSDVTVVVVPNINPDGYQIGERKNANNVDLNRNFPANNWKKDVTVPGGELVKNGGGTEALSEPESKAIANYTLALNPTLVLTYHARGSLAVANESGNSLSKATEYGSISGFSALGNSALGDTFDYDTTGAYEDWLHDKHAIPALLIELSTATGNEFTQQSAAMWQMLQ